MRTIRRTTGQVATLIFLGLFARVLLIDHVAIWGDMGFYTYDARLLQQGQVPFVDFVGRSPLFNYGYAAFASVVGNAATSARLYITIWWIAAAPVVYLFARDIHSHRAGLAGLALYLFVPFGAVYGLWTNTQSLAALLAVSAAHLLYRFEAARWAGVAGVLLGLAFLSRRSVVAACAGIGAWMLWDARRTGAWRAFAARTGAVVAGAIVTPMVGYAIMAGGDLGRTVALLDTHALGLFKSAGRGGFPLLSEAVSTAEPEVMRDLSQGAVPIFNDLCQMCGSWTARAFAKTLLVTVPVVAPLAVYVRDITDRYYERVWLERLGGALGVLACYAVAVSVWQGYYIRVAVVISVAAFVAVAYATAPIDRDILYARGATLLVAICAGLAVGYLYRNRILHTYYFMDFWPFLAALSGVVLAAGRARWDVPVPRLAPLSWRHVAAVALAVGLVTSAVAAHPLGVAVTGNDEGWFTPDNIDEQTGALADRVERGEVVFTGSPSYVSGTSVRMWEDRPRAHYFFVTFNDTALGDRLYQNLTRDMRRGDIEYVIMDDLTANIFGWNRTARQAFVSHYCLAARAPYNQSGGVLLRWVPDSQACPAERRGEVILDAKR